MMESENFTASVKQPLNCDSTEHMLAKLEQIETDFPSRAVNYFKHNGDSLAVSPNGTTLADQVQTGTSASSKYGSNVSPQIFQLTVSQACFIYLRGTIHVQKL
jgi:hypothetical protein